MVKTPHTSGSLMQGSVIACHCLANRKLPSSQAPAVAGCVQGSLSRVAIYARLRGCGGCAKSPLAPRWLLVAIYSGAWLSGSLAALCGCGSNPVTMLCAPTGAIRKPQNWLPQGSQAPAATIPLRKALTLENCVSAKNVQSTIKNFGRLVGSLCGLRAWFT